MPFLHGVDITSILSIVFYPPRRTACTSAAPLQSAHAHTPTWARMHVYCQHRPPAMPPTSNTLTLRMARAGRGCRVCAYVYVRMCAWDMRVQLTYVIVFNPPFLWQIHGFHFHSHVHVWPLSLRSSIANVPSAQTRYNLINLIFNNKRIQYRRSPICPFLRVSSQHRHNQNQATRFLRTTRLFSPQHQNRLPERGLHRRRACCNHSLHTFFEAPNNPQKWT